MAKLKTATAVGALVDMMAAEESLKSRLAQLETETLVLREAAKKALWEPVLYRFHGELERATMLPTIEALKKVKCKTCNDTNHVWQEREELIGKLDKDGQEITKTVAGVVCCPNCTKESE